MQAPESQHDCAWWADPDSAWGGGKLPPYRPELCVSCGDSPANDAYTWGTGRLCEDCHALVCPDCHDALKHAPEAQRCVLCEAEQIMEFALLSGAK